MKTVHLKVNSSRINEKYTLIPNSNELYSLPGNAFKLMCYIQRNRGVFNKLIRKNIYDSIGISRNAYYKALDDLEENNFLHRERIGTGDDYRYYFDISGNADIFYEIEKAKNLEKKNSKKFITNE